MAAMLDFKDVELYYDHVYALKGVSLTVNQGETVALIGPMVRASRQFCVQSRGWPNRLKGPCHSKVCA